MTPLEIQLASCVVHFVEHQLSSEPMDKEAVDGILSQPDVNFALKEMKESALLPLPRSEAVYKYMGIS